MKGDIDLTEATIAADELEDRRRAALDRHCPDCSQPPRFRCKTPAGAPTNPHSRRMR